ncbi:MAG: hypothetical protein J6Y20_00515 [Lachnospiraceae bacterium]|nr:hypothetical protein [Lachnospiraceae bacterium]
MIREAPEDKPWVNYSTARKVRCENCLEFNEPGSTTCRFCGAAITAKVRARAAGRKICTCGYKNLPKVTVCLNCGGVILNGSEGSDT